MGGIGMCSPWSLILMAIPLAIFPGLVGVLRTWVLRWSFGVLIQLLGFKLQTRWLQQLWQRQVTRVAPVVG